MASFLSWSSTLGATLRPSTLPPPSLSIPPASISLPPVFCGRGDKKTAKGKRFRHSYGNTRPRKADKSKGLPLVPLPPRPPKKDPLDDGEFIEIVIDENLFTKKA